MESFKDKVSDSEEMTDEESNIAPDKITKSSSVQNFNSTKDIAHIKNATCDLNEENFKKFESYFRLKIQYMKKELENVVKQLISKYQEQERNIENIYEIKLNDKLKQFYMNFNENCLNEINDTIKTFGKEKSDNVGICFEDFAKSLFHILFDYMEFGKDKLEEKVSTEKIQDELKQNNQIDKESFISLFIKNTLSEDDSCDEMQNHLKEELVMINQELHELKQKKKHVEEKFDKEVATLIQNQQRELIFIRDQISSEYVKGKNLHKGEIIDQIENLRKNQADINMLWKTFCKEKNSLKLEKEKIIKDVKLKYLQENGYLKDRIKELTEEKHSLLSKHEAEINKINYFHGEKFHKLLKELKMRDVDNIIIDELNENFKIMDAHDTSNLMVTDAQKQNSDAALEALTCDLENKSKELKELQMKYNKIVIESGKSKELMSDKVPYESDKVVRGSCNKNTITDETCQDLNLKLELLEEMEQLQLQMEKDMAMYNQENSHLLEELLQLKSKFRELEKSKKTLEIELEKMKLKEKQISKRLQSKQNKDWSSNTELSTVDVQSWQVQAAQTNSRLLHVLSDLVKTFFDIEQDINNRLIQLGLDALHPAENNFQQDEEGTLIPVGSREDFTVFMGETMNLELSEDGPDLTPRSWDLFTSSIAAHEVEMEGEDVVLGASKRLRAAVERVLRLLTHAVEAQQTQDLRVLLHRNEALAKELQEETQHKDFLQMELIRVEALLRNSEQERQKLDDIINSLKETKESLVKELNLLRRQLHYMEETQETLSEEKRYAKEQCQMLANNVGQAEQALLKENNKLNSDKHKLQQNHDKERQQMLSRIHHLELVLEETISQKEDLLEEKCHEIEDLKSQMESVEKQLLSYKRFIEEQAQEREQERDEYLREVKKLQEIVKEKDRIQNNDERLSREVELLEQQLKSKMEDQREILKKREQAEADLRQSVDKIHDLRDIISELECQLDIKINAEKELNQKIANLEETLLHHEKENADLNNEIERLQAMCANNELKDHVQALKEQLESKGQQLEQMKNCQSLLQEFHSYIHSLEVKIDSTVSSLQLHKLSYPCSSPIPSDTSLSEQDGELRPLSEASLRLVDDIRVYSPSTSNWDEMKRFEDKLDNLVKAEEELVKINKNLTTELKTFKETHEEILHEKIALQEQVNNQLLQISALKAQIEEHRHHLNGQMNVGNHTKIEIFQLQEDLLKERQQQELLNNKIQELLKEIDSLKELDEKDRIINSESNLNSSENETLIQEISSLKEENTDLKQEVEKLRSNNDSHTLPDYAKLLLDDKNEEIEFLNQQVHNLQGLIQTYHDNEKEKQTMKENKQPELSDCQKCSDLQLALSETTSEKNNLQQQINTLMKELESLNRHHGLASKTKDDRICKPPEKLQEDFDVIQKIADQQEKELVQLQEETYNQRKEFEELETGFNRELSDARNCLECKALNEQLTTLKTNFQEENTNLIMKLEQLQNKLVEVENKSKEEKEIIERNYKIQIEDINLQAKKVESLLQKTHEEEISHIKSHLEGIFHDEKEVLINLHKEKLNSLESSLKQKHENEKAELKNHFQEVLQNCKAELARTHNSEKQKLELEHDENINYMKSQYEKQICSERINSQEKQEEAMKEFEETLKRNWEEEKKRLIALHQNEIERANNEMKERILVLQNNFEEMYQNKLAQLENNYKHEIKTLKSLLQKSRSDLNSERRSFNSRDDTSNSDISSSQNTTVCTEEDIHGALPSNIEKLLKKVYKEGVQVLSLTERQLLKHHLTPSSETGKSCLTSEEWFQERQMLLNEIYSLKELIREGVENKSWKDTIEQIVSAFRSEQEKLISKLRNEVHTTDNAISTDNKKLNERITDLEVQNEVLNTHVTNRLVEEYKSATIALNNQQIQYIKVKEELEHKLSKLEEEKMDLEEQLKTQRNVLEFRIKQEKVLSDDLQKSLDAERNKNVDLRSQLNKQQKAYMELESSYSTYKAEIACLRNALDQQKKHLTNCLTALGLEKATNRSLMQALEREQTNFSSLQAEFDSERKCGKVMQEYEHQIIKLHRLYWKYRRSESYRQALIFQKNYLLMLLEGFQSTEKQTLTTLKCMMIGDMDEEKSVSSSSFKYNPHKYYKFRSAAYAIIAVHRMKYLVHRWRKAAKIMNSHVATQELNSEEQNAIKNGAVFNSSKLHSSSSPSSLHGHHTHPFCSNSLPCRKQSIQSNPTVSETVDSHKSLKMLPKPSSDVEIHQIEMERGRLGEYITRLEFLHQQLGLNTRDK
ncbi:A-kinase anchor protein 9-like isoform X3 [Centruroides sculpturatus]|uniref:A-kinase anchor protein 9-like isoform X3 n=1 Tax=Centruroides sculpturatus TaxID=218467 RepID=UPI000C6CE553|nr:A-kinase anchor protein 9-like isoform X3 [Centruroides sculpturatus]